MIYFDNAASTYKKPNCVINSIKNSLMEYSANPGRSGHFLSIKTEEKVSEARERIKEFVNASSSNNVIFTQNCTDALNLAILGSVKSGGHIITTSSEHNSTLRPIHELKRMGLIDVTIISPKKKGFLTLDDIYPAIRKNTYMIATVHISNVDGTITDVYNIGKFCREKNLIYLVDAAQSAGHIEIDLYNMNIDLLAIAGHKGLFGPQGIGVLVKSDRIKLKPIRYGGTGTESISVYQPLSSPECYESGTISTPNILGLSSGIEFVSNNFHAIKRQLSELSIYLIKKLSEIEEVIIYTNIKNDYGVVAFNIRNEYSSSVSDFLSNEYEICTRSGLHCAPLKHKELDTIRQGIIRVSFSFYNKFEEIDIFIEAIKKYISISKTQKFN